MDNEVDNEEQTNGELAEVVSVSAEELVEEGSLPADSISQEQSEFEALAGDGSSEDVVADFIQSNGSDDDESLDQALLDAAQNSEVAQVADEVKEEIEHSELAAFESAEIEEEEFIPLEQMESIIESLLFASDKPLSMAAIKTVFKGTTIKTKHIKKAIEQLQVEYASAHRGVTLEQVSGGYQLKTKVDNMDYLKRMVKARPFKLSGPAMEVLAIVAYKQPLIKADIDEIRGVESGHLLRALMEKGIVSFAGKSDLPGKPMLYETSRKFLDIFSLKSIKELPTLSEIDELLPDGIGEEEVEKETLSDLTEDLSEQVADSYSEGEEELLKITDKLSTIETSSDFFEEEKRRQKEKRDRERAKDIQDALDVGEEVEDKDVRWLARYNDRIEQEKIEKEADAVKMSDEERPVEDIKLNVDETDQVTMIEAVEAIKAFEEDDASMIISIDESPQELPDETTQDSDKEL